MLFKAHYSAFPLIGIKGGRTHIHAGFADIARYTGLRSEDAVIYYLYMSGDSDLKAPVEMVRQDFSKTAGVINPQKVDCKILRCAASFNKRIRVSDLAASQLPTTLTDATGTFHKPTSW